MPNDWLTALKNSPVGKLPSNAHLFQGAQVSDTKKKISRKESKKAIWVKDQLAWWCKEKGYTLLTEHKFHEYRKFRFDNAIKEIMVAVEFEGGIWLKGGGAHSRPVNIERDIAKYNLAQSLGWKIIRVHSNNYKTVIQELEKIL